MADPLSADGRAAINAHGLVVVCLSTDALCRKTGAVVADAGGHAANASFTRSFLGASGQPMNFEITVVPPARAPARTTETSQ
jgi:hypothetical protein